METVRLEPVRIGFPWEVVITWPEGYLQVGETFRASLRRNPNDAASLADCVVSRDGDVVIFSLSAAATAPLEPGSALMDLVLVAADATEMPITSPRFKAQIEHHTTRASA